MAIRLRGRLREKIVAEMEARKRGEGATQDVRARIRETKAFQQAQAKAEAIQRAKIRAEETGRGIRGAIQRVSGVIERFQGEIGDFRDRRDKALDTLRVRRDYYRQRAAARVSPSVLRREIGKLKKEQNRREFGDWSKGEDNLYYGKHAEKWNQDPWIKKKKKHKRKNPKEKKYKYNDGMW